MYSRTKLYHSFLVLSLAPVPIFEFEDFHGVVSIPLPSIFICCETNRDELEGCSSRHADWFQRLIPTLAHAQFPNSEVIFELKESLIACVWTLSERSRGCTSLVSPVLLHSVCCLFKEHQPCLLVHTKSFGSTHGHQYFLCSGCCTSFGLVADARFQGIAVV